MKKTRNRLKKRVEWMEKQEIGSKNEMDEAVGLTHVDRLSKLPELIIYNIYSFLPAESILVSSTLSKSWHHFTYISFLVFDYNYHSYVRSSPLNLKRNDMCCLFLKEIDDNVCRRLQKVQASGSSMYAFNMAIYFPDTKKLAPRLDFWLSQAVKNNVSEVFLKVMDEIDVDPSTQFWPRVCYNVPEAILLSTTLKCLELAWCRLEGKSSTKLHHLCKLVLNEVFVTDDSMFQNLSCCCPLLEHLNLNACNGIKELATGSRLNQLRHLELDLCKGLATLHVDAPNLHTFAFNVPREQPYLPCEVNLGASTALKVLKLCRVEMSSDSFEVLLLDHPCIQYLELKRCNFLSHLIMRSEHLKSLILRQCSELNIVDIDAPNLVSVNHDNPSTLFSIMNNVCLGDVHIKLDFASQDMHWWLRLEKYLKKTCSLKNLKFALRSRNLTRHHQTLRSLGGHCSDVLDVVIHDKMKDVYYSSLSYLLKSNPIVYISSLSYTDLLDDLFESSKPRTLSLVCPKKTAKLIFEDVMNYPGNWSKCPRESHFQSKCCWQGYFRGFKVNTSKETKKLICDDSLITFLKEQSYAEYKITTVGLKWFKVRPSSWSI